MDITPDKLSSTSGNSLVLCDEIRKCISYGVTRIQFSFSSYISTRLFTLVDVLIESMAHMESSGVPSDNPVTLTYSMHTAGAPFCLSVARLISVKFVPFTTPGVLDGTLFDSLIKFFRGRGLLLNLGDKETSAPGFQRPDAASVLRRAFRLLSARVQKVLWRASTLKSSSAWSSSV